MNEATDEQEYLTGKEGAIVLFELVCNVYTSFSYKLIIL